jgi:hypothetical protein
MNIQIEQGIPIPPRSRWRKPPGHGVERKYPWMMLRVGDSFVFPMKTSLLHTQRLASTHICYRHRHSRLKYISRLVEEAGEFVVRIWRVE